MRKMFTVFLIISLLFFSCMLSGCSNQKEVSGKVVQTNIDDNIGVISFVVQSDDKEIGILMTDETSIISFVDGMTVDDFKAGFQTEAIVSVECETSRRTLTKQDGQKLTAYNAKQIQVTGFLTTETAVLSDGACVDIWQYSNTVVYTLQNGTELLRIQNPSGPNNVYVGGVESLDDLEDGAQRNILEFYKKQGLLYDTQVELENAYSAYLQEKDSSQFDSHMISQDISPTASSENVIYFLTTVFLPIDGNHGYEQRFGAAFDKNTGEYINNLELFSCDPENVLQEILDIVGEDDSILRREMEQAFRPENIILFSDNLEVCFQYGTLSSQENSYLLGLDYDDRILEILNEWAIPIEYKHET